MRTSLTLSLVLVLSALATTADAGIKLVATVPDLAAISKEIGGDKVDVTALSLPTQDPHFVDAKPSIVLKLNKADLLVAVGLELEVGWLPALQTQARNAKILAGGAGYLDCSTAIDVRDAATGQVDRSQGDIHPNGNPHYLYDPRQAAKCAQAIGAKLVALDGANAKLYRANLQRFLASLATARKGWEQRLAPFRGHAIVSYHKSMTYLVDWLGLDEVATLEPKPGIPPTPNHVASILQLGKAKGVKVILEESYYPDKTGTLVARKLGGTVVRLPGGADVSRGETYVQHMNKLIDDLEGALKWSDVLVQCRGLEVGYRGRPLLPPVDLDIRRGRMSLILGRNGSGKTTLVRTLLGLQPEVRGSIRWTAGTQRAFVPQSAAIDTGVPIRADDVVAWGRMRGWSFLWPIARRGDRAHCDQSMAALDVGHVGGRRLRDLSGGQVQRVLFARMLAGQCDVAVLDEPTAAMDAAGERAVYATLRGLARERQIAVVVVTHAVSAALGACDEVLLLDPDTAPGGGDARDAGGSAGRVVLGTPDEIAQDPAFHSLFGVSARPDHLDLLEPGPRDPRRHVTDDAA